MVQLTDAILAGLKDLSDVKIINTTGYNCHKVQGLNSTKGQW